MNTLATATNVFFKNVLFLTDLTEASQPAFRYALAFAHHYGAQMYPAHVVIPSGREPQRPNLPDLMALTQQQKYQQLNELIQHAGSKNEPLVCVDSIENAVRHWTNEYAIDLIVVGTHGRRGVQRFLLGSTAEMILRTATCPVLTVGPHVAHGPDDVASVGRILFAVGMTVPSAFAVSYVLSLAHERHARLTILRVMPPNTGHRSRFGRCELASNELRRLVPPDAETSYEPEFILDEGDPEEQILVHAQRDLPDLIVLALPTRNSFSTLGTGVTYKVVSSSPSAVLTVPDAPAPI